MTEHIQQLTKETFDKEVLQADVPVLVDFWAPWCMPCRMMAPVLEEIAQEWKGKVNVCKLNTDEISDIAGRYGIHAIPTMIVFHQGKEVDRIVGYVPRNSIENTLQSALKK